MGAAVVVPAPLDVSVRVFPLSSAVEVMRHSPSTKAESPVWMVGAGCRGAGNVRLTRSPQVDVVEAAEEGGVGEGAAQSTDRRHGAVLPLGAGVLGGAQLQLDAVELL